MEIPDAVLVLSLFPILPFKALIRMMLVYKHLRDSIDAEINRRFSSRLYDNMINKLADMMAERFVSSACGIHNVMGSRDFSICLNVMNHYFSIQRKPFFPYAFRYGSTFTDLQGMDDAAIKAKVRSKILLYLQTIIPCPDVNNFRDAQNTLKSLLSVINLIVDLRIEMFLHGNKWYFYNKQTHYSVIEMPLTYADHIVSNLSLIKEDFLKAPFDFDAL